MAHSTERINQVWAQLLDLMRTASVQPENREALQRQIVPCLDECISFYLCRSITLSRDDVIWVCAQELAHTKLWDDAAPATELLQSIGRGEKLGWMMSFIQSEIFLSQ